MGTGLIEMLADCVDQIEEFSLRISHLQAGEAHHRARFGDGPWEDITPVILSHYQRLLGTYTHVADDLRRRIDSGEI